MYVKDFNYELPEDRIARYPYDARTQSRLLCLSPKKHTLQHRHFNEFESLLNKGDCLVLNNTKVIPARLFAVKETGGRVEIVIERVLNQETGEVLAHVRSSKPLRVDNPLLVDNHAIHFLGRCPKTDLFRLKFPVSNVSNASNDSTHPNELSLDNFLERYGHIPIPHYFKREDEILDKTRYQTVYCSEPGSVAAPTAGLHFDELLLKALQEKGVELATVTLNIGAGTFQPVRVDRVIDHKMHSEWMTVPEDTCQKVINAKKAGHRVIAVGTTSVRCLETAAKSGIIRPYLGETDLFIYPGYPFKIVDAVLTNFHLPASTLLMLVCAFAGYEFTMKAYQEAIHQGYRFFSYGDAMFIDSSQEQPC